MNTTGDPSRGALAGLRVLTFESRRSRELAGLLGRHGATVVSAPALREVPLEENPAAVTFLERLAGGELDALICLTGVGMRALVAALESRCPALDLAARLSRIALVARGPKPVAALRDLGLRPTVLVPEPNTWRELLAALDRELPVRGLRIAVQEYGRSNPDLLGGLEARGASVLRVPVYRWALPLDSGPLRDATLRLARGEIELAVFTTAVQLDHLLEVAGEPPSRTQAVLAALGERVAVAAIGPTAREALAAQGLRVDIVPEHPKLGYLVAAIAAEGPAAVARKRAVV